MKIQSRTTNNRISKKFKKNQNTIKTKISKRINKKRLVGGRPYSITDLRDDARALKLQIENYIKNLPKSKSVLPISTLLTDLNKFIDDLKGGIMVISEEEKRATHELLRSRLQTLQSDFNALL
jgi:hypothetical protein